MIGTDVAAAIIAILVLIYWRRANRMANSECAAPRLMLPNNTRAWTQEEATEFRLEAETLRWMLDMQRAELLRMYAATAADAERIEWLETEVDALLGKIADMRETDRGERAA